MVKPSLVFLPGFACQPWIWEEVALQLGLPFQALAWPDGESIQALTQTLLPQIPSDALLVGHSMGGLAGLEFLRLGVIRHLVLVETFLTPPPPFFRNLLLEGSPWFARVQEMLELEKRRYPSTLADSLKAIDSLPGASAHAGRIHAVYGDRGSGNPSQVLSSLEWPPGLAIPVRVVSQSCHFPMLENPQALAEALEAIIRPMMN